MKKNILLHGRDIMITPKETKKASTVLYDHEVLEYLKRERIRTGYSMSELVNMIVKNHIKKEQQKENMDIATQIQRNFREEKN